MARITPGRWKVERSANGELEPFVADDAGDWAGEHLLHGESRIPLKMREANARAIESVPQLLAAIARVLDAPDLGLEEARVVLAYIAGPNPAEGIELSRKRTPCRILRRGEKIGEIFRYRANGPLPFGLQLDGIYWRHDQPNTRGGYSSMAFKTFREAREAIAPALLAVEG